MLGWPEAHWPPGEDAAASLSAAGALLPPLAFPRNSLISSVTQKHFTDEAAAKRLHKLSTLLRVLYTCVRSVCTAEAQSGRIFKVFPLPKLQFLLLCLNFTAIFLQCSDTYIKGDVLYQSCRTACNSPGSSVDFYAGASIKELQIFQVFPMRTE